MFSGCTSLTTCSGIMKIGENTSGRIQNSCCENMLANCTALNNFKLTVGSYANIGNTNTRQYAFHNMFKGCTALTNSQSVISIFVTNPDYGQYCSMFEGCTALNIPPDITCNSDSSYSNSYAVNQIAYEKMFKDCVNLLTIDLDSFGYHRNVAASGYASMFQNCTKLNLGFTNSYAVLNLPVYSIAGMGAELQNQHLTGYAYAGMFAGCTSLIVAPVLTGGYTVQYSYSGMFVGCSNLLVVADGN